DDAVEVGVLRHRDATTAQSKNRGNKRPSAPRTPRDDASTDNTTSISVVDEFVTANRPESESDRNHPDSTSILQLSEKVGQLRRRAQATLRCSAYRDLSIQLRMAKRIVSRAMAKYP
ncbi:MAG: hypothetical protein AAFP90_17205, partial [Planctomycetota bacterium]